MAEIVDPGLQARRGAQGIGELLESRKTLLRAAAHCQPCFLDLAKTRQLRPDNVDSLLLQVVEERRLPIGRRQISGLAFSRARTPPPVDDWIADS